MFGAALSMGMKTAFDAGLYYTYSEVFELGNSKASAIFGAANAVVSSVATSASLIGVAALISKDANFYGVDTSAQCVEPSSANVVIATAIGTISGILLGKKICQWSGNAISVKQIATLALIYGVETAVLSKLGVLHS